MPLIDLEEVDLVARLHPLWSSRHAAPSWFRRADFMGSRDIRWTSAFATPSKSTAVSARLVASRFWPT